MLQKHCLFSYILKSTESDFLSSRMFSSFTESEQTESQIQQFKTPL